MIDLNNYNKVDFSWDFTCFSKPDKNPIGVQLPLYHIGENMYTKFQCLPNHVGWNKVIHGGVIALICDDILGKHVFTISKSFCMTRSLNIKYIRPAYNNIMHIFKTNVIERTNKTIWIRVEIYDERENLCAYADGDFAIISNDNAKYKNITSIELKDLIKNLN